jgi:hypothetical protein
MSYEKAMRHHANVKKTKKQASMHFGFDTNSVQETSFNREANCLLMNVRAWFRERHEGNSSYNRECVREAIDEYRALFV